MKKIKSLLLVFLLTTIYAFGTGNSIGGFVWSDQNNNGLQDSSEIGIANVEVKLYASTDCTGTAIAVTNTSTTGYYTFNNLPISTYTHCIAVVYPSNFTYTEAFQGSDESLDSNLVPMDSSMGKIENVLLDTGATNFDAGLIFTGNSTVKVGDRVFYDSNKNGIQDLGEEGVCDVEVKLYKADNTLVATTTTSSSGIYLFDNVAPGEYYIVFTKPAGYSITKTEEGNDREKDSDANVASGRTKNFVLVAGINNSSIDMGVYQETVSLGDKVFIDTNNNGLQDAGEKGVKDINVTVFSENSSFSESMLTDENGIYVFTNLSAGEYSLEFKNIPNGYLVTKKDVNNNGDDLKDSDAFLKNGKVVTESVLLTPGVDDLSWDLGIYKPLVAPGKAVIGNLVFEDLNKDGIQDIGEPGVVGVKVELFDNDTGEKVATTVTDANGLYEFKDLDPACNYYVQFTVPNGFVVSPQNQGNDTVNSDADETGKTAVIVLEADTIYSTIDMGIYREGATIGDKVFLDELNGVSNGIQDAGEQGANDIKVTLYSENGEELNTTRTNASGVYHFTNVPKGKYRIGFSDLPEGYIFALAGQGNDPEKDSNVNSNGKTELIIIDNSNTITGIDAGLKRVLTATASNDLMIGITGQNAIVDVLANDNSGDSNFNPSTVKITLVPEGASLSADGRVLTVPNEGVWRVDANTGVITFTPANGFVGDPTPITYSVQDTEGNEASAEVEINYPPVANDDKVNAQAGEVVIIDVLKNDKNTSSPLNPTSVRLIDPVSGNAVETVNVAKEGVWNVNVDGSITFTPNAGFVNVPTPIEYIVREVAGDISNRATITILYPDAVDDSAIIPNNGQGEIIINVAENDSNNTIATEVTLGCQQPGVKTLVVNGEGTWRVGNNGNVVFTPEANLNAQPTDIQYTIGLISGGRSNCATISLQHELLAVDDTSTLNVGGVTLINILNNDLGTLDTSSVKLLLPLNPVAGSSVSADGKTLTVPGQGVWTVNNLGVVSFTAENGFKGVPRPIRYTVENNNGLVSNISTITLTQGGVSVIANDDIGVANGGNPIVINVLANDTGDINRSSVRIIGPNGAAVKELVVPGEGTWVVNDNGTITFTGEVGYVGTLTPIKYTVSNNGTVTLSDTATITISGTCVCTPYETSIPAMGQIAALLMLVLTLFTSMFFFRKEYN